MTDINDIISDNWDTDICSKPAIIDDSRLNRRWYQRVVSTRRSTTIDEIEGITGREFFNPDSYDGWICWAISNTESDCEDIIKAIKKICATYSPTSSEKILEWEGGNWRPFNGIRYEFRFVLLKRKSGVAAY